MKVFEKLRQARIQEYKSMAEFVRKFGLTYTTYQGHENGSREMSFEDLKHYARALKRPIGWFTSETDGDTKIEKDGLNKVFSTPETSFGARDEAAQFMSAHFNGLRQLSPEARKLVLGQLVEEYAEKK